ncbi:hypothetical protein [Sinanaerobacter chloroacetimidivorans]|uniref:Uncharacterized protein n=1 Tax=Sinanaerobacter chloroacetimidivorans TaxID=2818044 RepID=A0A8J8B3N0_9FIRM|nr:hypothetical protein [Sinanaerobacter chloroacetimidivorans]MBR0600489.1 hypothetical protein [Sinanaerobacter chloroacetimidivorans]
MNSWKSSSNSLVITFFGRYIVVVCGNTAGAGVSANKRKTLKGKAV